MRKSIKIVLGLMLGSAGEGGAHAEELPSVVLERSVDDDGPIAEDPYTSDTFDEVSESMAVQARAKLEPAGTDRSVLRGAIQKLQPWFTRATTDASRIQRTRQLDELVEAVAGPSKAHGIDPLLSVAIAFRESSLMPEIGVGQRRGRHGDVGYFQIIPGSAAQRVCGDCQNLSDPMCNATIATCYMRHIQERCNSTNPWIWLGGYGRSRCPRNVREAREWRELRRARYLYCKIREDCETIWPS